jgi:hypothetical protein
MDVNFLMVSPVGVFRAIDSSRNVGSMGSAGNLAYGVLDAAQCHGMNEKPSDRPFASTPEPPYYAVIFSNQRAAGGGDDAGYAAMAERVMTLALAQPGCLDAESARVERAYSGPRAQR